MGILRAVFQVFAVDFAINQPVFDTVGRRGRDSNLRTSDYESDALTTAPRDPHQFSFKNKNKDKNIYLFIH